MTPAERMTEQAKRLAAVLREHLPKDRYDDDGVPAGTFCTGCDWQGDYFADGEAGPFDDHLAAAILASDWLAAYVAAERDRAVREALAGVRTHNETPVTAKNLRWAATHEALCRTFIFDVLTGLAAALPDEPTGEDAP